MESVVNLYEERNEVSNLYEENSKDEAAVMNKAEASKIEKCPQKKWNVAEEDSDLERLKQRLDNDTPDS